MARKAPRAATSRSRLDATEGVHASTNIGGYATSRPLVIIVVTSGTSSPIRHIPRHNSNPNTNRGQSSTSNSN